MRGFTQREPLEGAVASEQTMVLVLVDDEAIYFGAVLEDSEPQHVTAALHGRDLWKLTGLWDYAGPDDSFAVLLDTFSDRRNGYYFAVNPNGARTDAHVTGEGLNRNFEWDGVWHAAARRHEEGWTTEIAIPFKTLRYPSSPERHELAFGLNFQRVIRRKNEESFWAPVELSATLWWFSRAGRLTGLPMPGRRRLLEAQPFVVAQATRFGADAPTSAEWQPGIDVRAGLTSGLTANATVNTDFAQVEVDQQQINFTRFSLFFPEKREFFLEGAGIFNFGFRDESKLFFSRRIGLDAGGREVPMTAGGRVSGRAGPYEVGALIAATGRTDAVPRAANTVVRVRRQVFGRSSIGAMFTGVRSAAASNHAIGFDSDVTMLRYLTINSFWARSFDPARHGDQSAGSVYAHWDTDGLGAQYIFHHFGAAFAPALGFFPRTGIQRHSPGARVAWRPPAGPVRRYLVRGTLDWFHDAKGVQRTRAHMLHGIATLQNGDELLAQVNHSTEAPERPFAIGGGTIVPAGTYRFERGLLRYRMSAGRRYGASTAYSWGGFYGGTRRQIDLQATVKLSDHLAVLPTWEWNVVQLPAGHVTTTLGGLRVNYSHSNRLISKVFVQHNSATDRLIVNLRLDFIYRPNSHIYLVVNDARETGGPNTSLDARQRAVILKIVHLVSR